MRAGHAILRGPLADFPFDKKSEFSITTKINNIDFLFAPDWPVLRHVNRRSISPRLLRYRQSLTHWEFRAGLHGVIPYVGDAQPQMLEVTTDEIHTDFARFEIRIQVL